MEGVGQDSVQSISSQLRDSMTNASKMAFLDIIEPTETAMNFSVSAFLGKIAALNRTWDVDSFQDTYAYNDFAAYLVQANPVLSCYNFNYLVLLNTSFVENVELKWSVQWFAFARYTVDPITSLPGPAVYCAELALSPSKNESLIRYFSVNKLLGVRSNILATLPRGRLYVGRTKFSSLPVKTYWQQDIDFDQFSVFPTITLVTEIPTQDHHIFFTFWLQTSIYDVSKTLRAFLNSPQERLFLIFRTVKGTLIGASHGRFFSHSDFDYSENNPMTNPPPIADFRTFTPINSSDQTIACFGQWLLNTYGSWDSIPEFALIHQVEQRKYWASGSPITSKMGLKVELFLLIDHDSVLGIIEQQHDTTVQNIKATNVRLTILLACVCVVAVAGALLMAIALTRALDRLAHGMDRLAMLEFSGDEEREMQRRGSGGREGRRSGDRVVPLSSERDQGDERQDSTTSVSLSRFTEVSRCEASFVAMKRGIHAFVKYVPRDVVKLMLNGSLETCNLMSRKLVTVMFMDLVGFSSICERLTPEALMKLTTEYLESMCDVIVASQGTLDKFIGDCIMAMWNAPRPVFHHEAAACGAALDMQYKMVALSTEWERLALPALKFRVGINTGTMLVGNFGCDHRISYTCLGDGVNVASRLEGANKAFGTVVMVSESTQTAVSPASQILFRKLGLVTVPGKTQVLCVFEPLMRLQEPTEEPGHTEDEALGGSMRSNNNRGPLPPPIRLPSQTEFIPPCESTQSSPDGRLLSFLPLASRRSTIVDAVLTTEFTTTPGGEVTPVLFHWQWTSPDLLVLLKRLYEQALAEYIAGNVGAAEKLFEQAQRSLGPSAGVQDGATNYFIEVCHTTRQENHGNEVVFSPVWDGVLHFNKK